MPSLNTFQVNTSALHDSDFCQTIRISVVLSQGHKTEPSPTTFKKKKVQNYTAAGETFLGGMCFLLINHFRHAKCQKAAMEMCLDLSVSTNKSYKENR